MTALKQPGVFMCDTITKPSWESCRLLIEADLARFKADLAPLETGEVRVGECISDGDWHDITPAAISSQKRIISTLESMLNVLRP
ncbi:hypothetical protein [Bradyrhizobium sp.]|jgi:hypothetical protein